MTAPPHESAPVLCLDTCAILDVVRDPLREDVRLGNHAAAMSLLRAAEAEAVPQIRIAELVRSEFAENVETVQEEAEASLSRLRDQIRSMDELAGLYDSPGRLSPGHWDGHVQRCRAVADRWLEVGRTVSQSPEILGRAVGRVFQARAPSRRGRDSTKDCVILETYLEHVRAVRVSNQSAAVVFLSSNTQDFADPRGGVAREIAEEFDEVGLQYAPNMAVAKRLLGL